MAAPLSSGEYLGAVLAWLGNHVRQHAAVVRSATAENSYTSLLGYNSLLAQELLATCINTDLRSHQPVKLSPLSPSVARIRDKLRTCMADA